MSRRAWVACCSLLTFLLLAAPMPSLADCFGGPPLMNLINHSDSILVVKLGKPNAKGVVKLRVVRVIKGKKPAGTLSIDLTSTRASISKDGRQALIKRVVRHGDAPALLFIGKISDYRMSPEDEPLSYERALLHMDRTWLNLDPAGKGVWEMDWLIDKFQATWDGGTDMFIQAIEHTLAHPDDSPPDRVGCSWARYLNPGKITGKVHSMRAVDLDGRGTLALFIAADNGDRLYTWDRVKDNFRDVTGIRMLKSRSKVATWADFNGDGRLDLASWDGKSLQLYFQKANGCFGERKKLTTDNWHECLGLTPLDVGAGRRPGLVVSTPGVPVLLRPTGTGKYRAERLLTIKDSTKHRLVRACLVADFDGDGRADILQPFGKDSLVLKGKPGGRFEEPRSIKAAAGKSPAVTCVGDFDMDGLLDIYMTGKPSGSRATDGPALWHNRGGFKFVEALALSGEICYTAKPEAVSASLCDVNNDGRQELVIAHAKAVPEFYFNRGYRNLSRALSLSYENQTVIEIAKQGQQAITVADLNGDGGQDMALAENDGRIHVFLRERPRERNDDYVGVRVFLPASAGHPGPITVTAWNKLRCLGAWSITPGSGGAHFGAAGQYKMTIKWKLPGGKQFTKVVDVDDLNDSHKTVALEFPAASVKKPPESVRNNPPAGIGPRKPAGEVVVDRVVYWLLVAVSALAVVVTAVWIFKQRKK
jgi:VCBS repeat protein